MVFAPSQQEHLKSSEEYLQSRQREQTEDLSLRAPKSSPLSMLSRFLQRDRFESFLRLFLAFSVEDFASPYLHFTIIFWLLYVTNLNQGIFDSAPVVRVFL